MATDPPGPPTGHPAAPEVVVDNHPSPSLLLYNLGECHELPPPRRWLLEGTFCRGVLSGLAAGGGTGKTALRLLQLLAVATGREDLTGQRVLGRGRHRVLVVCLEDDFDEIHRRIRAACKYYEIPMDEVLDAFWVTAPVHFKLAVLGADGWRIHAGAAVDELRRVILEKGIDLVLIDPLLRVHEGNENDNGQMDAVVSLLIRLAVDRGCAVDFVHTPAKA
jgi:RecA-family ATPase